jgi:hypothetical protein
MIHFRPWSNATTRWKYTAGWPGVEGRGSIVKAPVGGMVAFAVELMNIRFSLIKTATAS